MSRTVWVLVGLGLLVMSMACATAKPVSQHRYMLVQDKACQTTVAGVHKVLVTSPDLGVAEQRKRDGGGAEFVLPPKEKAGLRYQAMVIAECRRPDLTRISVQVQAQRKASDGSWHNEPDTGAIESAILDRFMPK